MVGRLCFLPKGEVVTRVSPGDLPRVGVESLKAPHDDDGAMEHGVGHGPKVGVTRSPQKYPLRGLSHFAVGWGMSIYPISDNFPAPPFLLN